jgi:hypothetical protein
LPYHHAIVAAPSQAYVKQLLTWSQMMKLTNALLKAIAAGLASLNILLGYFLFYVDQSQDDAVTITIKILFMAMISTLYTWFMLSHRTSKGLSFRIWR